MILRKFNHLIRNFATNKSYAISNQLERLNGENQFEKLAEVVTPLYKIPYNKQLYLKQQHAISVLKELRTRLKANGATFDSDSGVLPCPLDDCIPSPETVGYRNKDEFSVQVGVDGNPKTVGHFYGSPSNPLMRCVPPHALLNIRDSHKLVSKHFQDFIRRSDKWACLNFSEGGLWRSISVRSNGQGQLMATVLVYSGGLESVEETARVKDDLKEYFFSGAGAECELSSLYFQACPHTKCSRDVAPFELIEGSPYIEEACLGRAFRISPDSFFQTNTKAAELLYSNIATLAETSSLTTILDICCGVGPVSVLMSPHCRGSVAIDSVQAAVEDAVENSRRNNVTNCAFVHGRVEKVLPLLKEELESSSNVVAVVNPPRAGLHGSVIECIRSCDFIRKVIYVTCKPEGASMHNMVSLCSAKHQKRKNSPRNSAEPFTLRYAVPLDMFPHTNHLEYIFLFDRD